MKNNDYRGVLARWKVKLVIARAKRLGFRREQWQDALQKLAPCLAKFVYDPKKGATKRTVLTELVDRRLIDLFRAESRLKAREEKAAPRSLLYDPSRQNDIALDVREALAALSPLERQVCLALGEDESQAEIAKSLKISRDAVRLAVDRVRQHFIKLGLDAWVCR